MSTKAGWDAPRIATDLAEGAVLPLAVEAVIQRAGHLTANEIARLDRADGFGAQARSVAWDLLRDALDRDPAWRNRRFAARRLAWRAVDAAAVAAGLEPVPDDGYWRVLSQPGAGAARLARFAACALLAPNFLDEVVADLLLEPWLAVVG